ncbi:TetR family transcriptional regulator [Sphingomonas psychrolutea]|uniref:TetR family transcriptional regulator n=2 Tax=Sphingomonas psychrolutea TaxID=1259676 RepID=A0ABQ1G8L2_9SPHN|nr:TetR family transcriptional regulator [Sphingomonas psychrolutea]
MLQHRLLEIAIAEFAAKGLEGASTRGIAAAAGTAMSSITYHYGGKEGLYLAAADYIALQLGEEMAPAFPENALLEALTPDDARSRIHAIVRQFIEAMSGEKSTAASLFIMREQMAPTEAFERIYGGLMGKMLETLCELVCTATGRDDRDTARIVVITLIGQVIVLRASRATVLKLLKRATIDAAATATLAARIAANTDAILDRLIAERQDIS